MPSRYYAIIVLLGVVNLVFTFTTGWNIANFVVSLVLVLLVAIPLGYQFYKKRQLGTMEVTHDPYGSPGKRMSKKADLEISDTHLLIYVSPRKGTSWDRVNIRLVKRKFSPRFNRIWRYEDADRDTMSISYFSDVIQQAEGEIPEPTGDRYFESYDDTVGGYNGDYLPPIYVKGGERVWYDVYTRANDFWKGLLSFEGSVDNHRAWVRIKAEVTVVKSTNPDGKVEELTKAQVHKIIKKASQPVKKSEKGKSKT